jgi:hypothetical protein
VEVPVGGGQLIIERTTRYDQLVVQRADLGLSDADGALAQLGERRLCKPEVTGSIPVRSIA